MGRVVKKIAPVALPILGTIAAPGIGTALGSTLGSTSLGAIGGAIGGGLGGAIGGGGLKGVATGAALGGLGGYVGSGGSVPGLGSLGGSLGPGGFGPPTPATGALGKLGSLTGASAAGGAQPMKLGSLLRAGGNVLSYGQGQDDIDEMRSLLEQQAGRAEAQFAPFSQAGQTALSNLQAPSLEALQNDPGYQFRLQQGQQALERSLAARGLGQSGAALKAAQEYGQGLADQTYNDYFGRQSQIAGMGLGAASGLGNIYGGLGDAQAAALRAQMENRNRLYGGFGSIFG